MRIAERVKELTEPTITELGYRLYDVDFLKEPEGYVLTLYIDSSSPITLDDCEKVSRAVEPILDEADPIAQAYYLSVSSIGLDRPLKLAEDFERNLGKELDIKLYAPIDNSNIIEPLGFELKKNDKLKQLCGVLTDYDDDSICITSTINKKEVKIKLNKKATATIKLHIDF